MPRVLHPTLNPDDTAVVAPLGKFEALADAAAARLNRETELLEGYMDRVSEIRAAVDAAFGVAEEIGREVGPVVKDMAIELLRAEEARAYRERANRARVAGLVPALLLTTLAALAVLAGCTTGRSHALEPRWRPLKSVEEASDKLLRPGLTTTISPHCYVPDLKAWLRAHPPGSVEYEAILLHEQVHAVRQEGSLGIAPWIGAYLLDPAFRWREEQAGCRVMLVRLVKAGRTVDAKALAASLADGYTLLGVPMVAEAEALAWVESVLAEARR